ncbi:anti-anti-sigma factor [Micromonospora nigra]|uniref:Anti-anti-sigma factor n=1 Tax=Micromonospora nigra TaxID=145857 RepID=A0A1C6SXL1_9ACTN|nr:STAS domain-containing protein [Micromonospora nigra]SCL34230.1 anti-anti-sigma factor [Micromonospora nigra]
MPGSVTHNVTVTFSPDRSRAVVKLGGELDMDARPQLDDAVHRLTVAAPDRVDIDVDALTYVGSDLPNFLVQVREAIPAGSVLTVSRPSPWTHRILRLTNMARIARIDDAIPTRTAGKLRLEQADRAPIADFRP